MKPLLLGRGLMLLALFGLSVPALAQNTSIVTDGYTLVGKKRVGRTIYEFTYRAEAVNGDVPVTEVSAMVTSNSANTVIVDSTVNFPDLQSGESVLSLGTFSFRQDRRQPFDPSALMWDVTATAAPIGPTVEVTTSPSDQSFTLGNEQNISTVVTFDTDITTSFTIDIAQSVSPEIGIELSPGVDGEVITTSSDLASTLNQVIIPQVPGEYFVTTTATIAGTGETSESTVRVEILPANGNIEFEINTPAASSGAVPPGVVQDLFFTVQVHGLNFGGVAGLTLEDGEGNTLFALADDGSGGDMLANDLVFSGTGSVSTVGLNAGDCLSFQANAATASGNLLSPIYELCVSLFPGNFVEPDSSPSNLIATPDSGDEQAIANELLLGFVEDTSEARIAEIAADLGGTVVGAFIDLNLYQLRFSPAAADAAVLQALIDTAQAFVEVEFAVPNTIVVGGSLTPTDTRFADQSGIKTIRADEAWYIARGAVTIAIVDSGADLDHPDLDSKIINGTDFVDGGTPEDEHGHGTHVAGIAGAESNNGQGIAGVSWGSSLLIVRVLDENNAGTLTNVVRGIRYAADQGARIVNTSLEGGSSTRFLLCAATSYAQSKGSLVVSAAGNQGSSSMRYPAACSGVIAVGNTTASDDRASTSSFGDWVDLAAPGTNILSTVPVGGTCTHCNSSGYGRISGTSQAAPMVAGAAAVLLSRQSLTNAQVEQRLERSAVELPSTAQLGAGRIDLFEAVFNGSFEEGNLALWSRAGTVASFTELGPLMPPDRKRMGYVSTGPDDAQTAGSLIQTFDIQPGVTEIPVSFNYAFISEEFPEFVGSEFNDSLRIAIVGPNGAETVLASEEINSSAFNIIGGLDFPGGDETVGWTGWKTVTMTIPVTGGSGSYRIQLSDAGDEIYDTVLLIDAIKFDN